MFRASLSPIFRSTKHILTKCCSMKKVIAQHCFGCLPRLLQSAEPTDNIILDGSQVKRWGKVHPCTGRTAHRGSRGIALPFLDQGTRRGWGVSVKLRPFFTPGKDPLYKRLGGPQGRSGQVRKISPPTRFDPWNVQPAASRYTDWATWPIGSQIRL
jgi:hypothetical protein